ncbi:DUF1937 family protein [Oleidesulfovibrio alaskensis]|uniref:DUF1937 family protein n=1 Tax=Oleidesulfovibrio alaskensis TaxID=58180 RepID=UPI0003FAF49A|nr:DUF1937 family protein [Oleidesulfovibrio alaskensis]
MKEAVVEVRTTSGIRLVYLATPYSHASEAVRHARFLAVTEVAARMWRAGLGVYSPITLTHEAARRHEMPTDWRFWGALCRATLEQQHEMHVLCLPGWSQSVGVQAEIALAKQLGLPVRYIEPDGEMLCAACPERIVGNSICSLVPCPYVCEVAA